MPIESSDTEVRPTMNRRSARLIFAGCIVLLLVVLVSCSGGPPSDVPGTTGAITAVDTSQTGAEPAIVLLVEGGPQPEGAVSDRASVTVTEDTRIFSADGSDATVDDLVEGAAVKVWFSGPVAESYPVQGTAGDIQLTGDVAGG